MKVRPDIQQLIKAGDSRFANSVTAGRAEAIMAGDSRLVLTGVVVTNPDTGEKFVVDNARTRWLDRDDWDTLINPPQVNNHKPTLSYQ